MLLFKKGVEYYVNMEFYTLFEDNNIKKLATDKEIKTINNDIREMKNALNDIEINSRHLNSRNFEHFLAMSMLISSIKRLTYLKIFVVAAISLFQIYIIRKFFGPEKRDIKLKVVLMIKKVFYNLNIIKIIIYIINYKR